MHFSPDEQLEFYKRLNTAWKSVNETSSVDDIFDLTLRFVHDILGFDRGIVFVQDQDRGLFKVVKSIGYEAKEQKRFLNIVQLLLSGEVVEFMRLSGQKITHTIDKPNDLVAKLTQSLFLDEAVFELFGGDVEVPYGMIVVGNLHKNDALDLSDQFTQISLNNLFFYLSNSISNTLFYRAWNEERQHLQENIDIRTRELTNQKDKFEAIYKTSKDGIAILDVHTSAFLDANPAYLEMTGFTLPELLRTSCIALSVPEDVERSKDYMAKVVETGSVKDFIKSCFVKDGMRITVNMSMALMADKESVLVAAKDMTARIELEHQLMDAKIKAEEATKIKSEFLANMSHEIRTPMNGVLGISQLALQHSQDSLQTSYLKKINSSAHSLLSIINDILDLSKIEAGKLELEHKEFSLFELIDSVVEMIELSVYEKGLSFVVSYQPGMANHVVGDHLRLAQVLTNLLSNAVKFTSQGEILLQVEQLAHNRFEFAVIDSGIGLTEDQKGQLFQSFYQVDSSSSKKYGGTGLGLVISKQLVHMMGGTLVVESTIGKGSRFSFDASLEAEPSKKVKTILTGKRVLLIESSPAWQKELTLRLVNLGGDVNLSPNLDLALQQQQKVPVEYDLVFLDLQSLQLDDLSTEQQVDVLQQAANFSVNTVLMVPAVQKKTVLDNAQHAKIHYLLEKVLSPLHLVTLCERIYSTDNQNVLKGKEKNVLTDSEGLFVGYRILVAEDNLINQDIVKGLLEMTGATLDFANDGLEAIELFKTKHYDLILMDVQMPFLDGLEATKEIRKFNQDIPIVALTANVMQQDVDKSLAVGMNDHLNKPIEFSVFYKVVAQYLAPQQTPDNKSYEIQDNSVQMVSEKLPNSLLDMDSQLLDVQRGLDYMGGNIKLYLKTLRSFIEKYRDLELEEKSSQAVLHALKGLSGNIGAKRLHQTIIEAENQGVAGYSRVIGQLESLLDALHDQSWLNAKEKPDVNLDKVQLSSSDAQVYFDKLKKAATQRSSAKCRSIVKELATFQLSRGADDRLDNIKLLLKHRNYQDIINLC